MIESADDICKLWACVRVCLCVCMRVKLIYKISSFVHNAVFNRANYSNYMNNFFFFFFALCMRRLSNWITMSLSPSFSFSFYIAWLLYFKCYKRWKTITGHKKESIMIVDQGIGTDSCLYVYNIIRKHIVYIAVQAQWVWTILLYTWNCVLWTKNS